MNWMRTGLVMALGAGVLVLVAASSACAQASGLPATAQTGTQKLLSSPGQAFVLVQSPAQVEIVREIDDPHTGDRWLLVRDPQHPGGPGRLMLVAAHRNGLRGTNPRVTAETDQARFNPVIRAGDRLIVEEHTEIADASLEARALNPAAQGSALDVRLTIGGKVVRAVALAPGRAALQPQTGERP